jgi:hypothetical protein
LCSATIEPNVEDLPTTDPMEATFTRFEQGKSFALTGFRLPWLMMKAQADLATHGLGKNLTDPSGFVITHTMGIE